MKHRRRTTLLLVVVLLGAGAFFAERTFWWVVTTRIPFEHGVDDEPVRGIKTVWRWDRARPVGRVVAWYTQTGMMAYEGRVGMDPRKIPRWTEYDQEGRVKYQVANGEECAFAPADVKKQPPWWWGVADQTTPSIPSWVRDDVLWEQADLET